MSAQHTPPLLIVRPWVNHSATTIGYIREDGFFVALADCSIGPDYAVTYEPLARCLAAAPELLEALQAEQEWQDRADAGELDPEWSYERIVGNKRRAAIAKAKNGAEDSSALSMTELILTPAMRAEAAAFAAATCLDGESIEQAEAP